MTIVTYNSVTHKALLSTYFMHHSLYLFHGLSEKYNLSISGTLLDLKSVSPFFAYVHAVSYKLPNLKFKL